MELRSLDYKFGGRNAEDTKREVNDLNKEIGVTREVRVTTSPVAHEISKLAPRFPSILEANLTLVTWCVDPEMPSSEIGMERRSKIK